MINIKNTQDDFRSGFVFKYEFYNLLKLVECKSRNSNSQESQL